MRRFAVVFILAMFCLVFSYPHTSYTQTEPADAVFKNATIYTVNERQPQAQAVAVKAGKIVFVGSNADAKKYEGKDTRVVDLHGNTLLPGLTDSHYHLSGVGAREVNLNLEGIESLAGFL